ncbi:MAG: hypothetical protein EA358_01050, partial [Flavobacteriales bacterium]
MKNNYSFKRFFLPMAVLALGLMSMDSWAQCIRTASWGSATVSDLTTTPAVISTCIYTNEFSPITVNEPGQYEFTITQPNAYFTLTDVSNVVIDHGPAPLTVSI